MKNKINKIIKPCLLAAITAICIAPQVRAGNNLAPEPSVASHKPPHGGGGGPTSLPYPTATTVSQIIADITYANSAGGAITINLAPGTTFDLTSANNTTDGNNGFPVIGGTKALALTITGNGDTIERIQLISRYYTIKNPFRLFDVAPGATLTLDKVTIKGGTGAILNHGTLNVMNGSLLSSNYDTAIYNNGGTVIVSDSTLSNNGTTGSGGGIFNAGGTVTITHSTLSNSALYYGGGICNSSGTVTISDSAVSGNQARFGGGIYNGGGTITIKDSAVNDNSANHYDYPWQGGYGGGIYNGAGAVVIDHSTVTGNAADPGLEDWSAVGGGIFNDSQGTVTVENDSHITGNAYDDVNNLGVLDLDGTSIIGILYGNSVIPF